MSKPLTKIQKFARGQDCTLLLDGVCNRDTETTILAHHSKLELGKGRGHKVNDLFAAHLCYACHQVVDGQVKSGFEREWIDYQMIRAVLLTQKRNLDAGLIVIL
jgi:hypothetical protein